MYIIFKCVHYFRRYAVREGSSMVKIFKNFKQKKAFKPDFGAEGELHFLFSHLKRQIVLCMDTVCICASLCVTLSILLARRYLWWLLNGSEVKQWSGLLRLGDCRNDPPYRDPA